MYPVYDRIAAIALIPTEHRERGEESQQKNIQHSTILRGTDQQLYTLFEQFQLLVSRFLFIVVENFCALDLKILHLKALDRVL